MAHLPIRTVALRVWCTTETCACRLVQRSCPGVLPAKFPVQPHAPCILCFGLSRNPNGWWVTTPGLCGSTQVDGIARQFAGRRFGKMRSLIGQVHPRSGGIASGSWGKNLIPSEGWGPYARCCVMCATPDHVSGSHPHQAVVSLSLVRIDPSLRWGSPIASIWCHPGNCAAVIRDLERQARNSRGPGSARRCRLSGVTRPSGTTPPGPG